MKNIFKLIISVIVCLLAGALGSLFTNTTGWYAALVKPSFNPPSWLFAPVWTVLYVMMGIALYYVLKEKKAIKIFIIQLILNTLWTILFFGMHKPMLALIDIILLWIMILITILTFYKIEKKAGYLLIPYLLWVTFATLLNLAIVILN